MGRTVRGALACVALVGSAGLAPGDAAAQRPPFALDTLRVQVGALSWSALPAAVRSVEVIDRARIQASPARTVADLLAWAVGVDVQPRSKAQADVAIRGSSFEQVLVLVDGVRVSDAQTAHFDLDTAVPLDEIERVEVLRGAASAQYGSDAMGGVIHIVTRRDGAAGGRLEAGSHGTAIAAASAALAVGSGRARAGIEYDRSDGARAGTDHEIGQARAGVDVALAGGTVRADVAYAFRDFGAADFYAPFPSYERTRTLTADLGWSTIAGSSAVEPRLSVRRHGDEFILRRDDPAFYRNVHTGWQYGGALHARHAFSSRVRVAAGGELFADRLESNALGERSATRAATFGELSAGAPGRWLLQSGVRIDWHSEFGDFVAPSAAAAFWPAERLRLRGSAGRSFRAPGWTERFYEDPANIGSPALLPERAWMAELGAELTFDVARIDIAAFIRDAEQLIDWARAQGADPNAPWRTMNIEDATFRGVEALLAVRGPLAIGWSLAGSVLSVDAAEAGGYISKYALRPLAHTAVLAADRTIAGGLDVGAKLRNARRVGEDAHTVADVRLSYRRGAVRVFADLTNLTDEEYLDVSVQSAPGRQLRIGVRWTGS